MQLITIRMRRGILPVLLYAFLMPLFSFSLQAGTFLEPPQATVSGTVTDTSGNPLAGVNLVVESKNIGTMSALDGSFTINAGPDDVLIFSMVGFKTLTVPIAGREEVFVSMEEDVTVLGEVVLNAGYYTVSEKERTGSIEKVSSVEIEKQPISNPLAALQGRMPGVGVVQTSGIAGSGFSIQIRGRNSVRDLGNEPLYIVDGVPYDSSSIGEEAASGILLGRGFSPLNTLNPMDIESIEVLKDADATAIYGSRGANGVVLITTKKTGFSGTRVSIGLESGLGRASRTMDVLNASEYRLMRTEAYANDGIDPLPFNAYDINGTWDPDRRTDWQRELFGNTSYVNNLQASITGGEGRTRFMLSGNYHGQTSVFKGDYRNEKISGLGKVSFTSKDDRLSLQWSNNFTWNNNDLPANDITFLAISLAPNAPELYNSDGSLNWENSTWNNPLSRQQGKFRYNATTMVSNASLDYTLWDGFKARVNLGYTESHLKEIRTNPSTIFDPAFGIGSESSSAIHNTGKRTSWIVEPQLEYGLSLGNTSVTVLTGLSFQDRRTARLSQLALGFSNNRFIENISAASTTIGLADVNQQYRYQAVFGRVNVNHNGKYVLNLTGRRDGSSRFGPEKRFSNFGAIGAAWIFSEEPLLKEHVPWLSFGKLRASLGTSGNDQIGDYQYLDTYSFGIDQYQNSVGIFPTRLFNPNFSWESNEKREVALELGMLGDRIRLNAAHYRNTSSNQLVGIPLPATTGFSSVNDNLNATVLNEGWEFGLNAMIARSERFSWETSLNLTIPKTRLESFPNLEGSTFANRLKVGEPLNIAKVYQVNGVDPETGLYVFEDFNNDGAITSVDDREAIARLDPKYFGGFTSQWTYGKLTVDALFQFSKQLGRNFWSTGGVAPGGLANQPKEVLDRWTPSEPDADIQRFTAGQSPEARQSYRNYVSSDAGISDASFLRLKTVSLSYNLVAKKDNGLGCMLFLRGQNLWTWTNYLGLDPETQNSATVPPLRMVTLGTRFTF